jgi:hypothetical protein
MIRENASGDFTSITIRRSRITGGREAIVPLCPKAESLGVVALKTRITRTAAVCAKETAGVDVLQT